MVRGGSRWNGSWVLKHLQFEGALRHRIQIIDNN